MTVPALKSGKLDAAAPHCLKVSPRPQWRSETIGRANKDLMAIEFAWAFTKIRISVLQTGRHVIGDHSLCAAADFQPSRLSDKVVSFESASIEVRTRALL